MIDITGTTITMTRGDTLIATVEILDEHGGAYVEQTDLTQVFDPNTNYVMEV